MRNIRFWALLLGVLLVACAPAGTPTPTPAPAITDTATIPATPTATPVPPATPSPVATTVPQAGAMPSPNTPSPTPAPTPLVFAVIGDYGEAGQAEADVAALVHGWAPDLVITTGDNNYPDGAADTIDENVGLFYARYIHPYAGDYGPGAETNRFFPTLGNHDWRPAGAQPYLDYFTLPGNERYYDFVRGPVHFFALDSDWNEPDGVRADSAQAAWLRERLAASTARWRIVYMHVPPYSSGWHGSAEVLRWPYREWGATAVLAGHDHTYERLLVDRFPYFVNGLGGNPSRYHFEETVPGSQIRFNDDYGAMRVEATEARLTFQFITRDGKVIDSYVVE